MIKLEDLSDDPTPEQIRQLDRTSLDLIPFERRWWNCAAKKCNGGTGIRDYGINPWYLLDRNSKESIRNPTKYWRPLDRRFMLCSKHYSPYIRLVKLYGQQATMDKLLDFHKDPVQPFKPSKKTKL